MALATRPMHALLRIEILEPAMNNFAPTLRVAAIDINGIPDTANQATLQPLYSIAVAGIATQRLCRLNHFIYGGSASDGV